MKRIRGIGQMVALIGAVMVGACSSFDEARFQSDLGLLLSDTTGASTPIWGVAGQELRSLPTNEEIAVLSAPGLSGQRKVVRGRLVSISVPQVSDTVLDKRRSELRQRSADLPRASFHRQLPGDSALERLRIAGQVTLDVDKGEMQTLNLYQQDVVVRLHDRYRSAQSNPFVALAVAIAIIGGIVIAVIATDKKSSGDPISDSADGCARIAMILVVGGVVIALVLIFGLVAALT